jgi:hypothetical protein
MNLVKIARKASGRLYNAIKKEDGGFVNPLVEFEGVDTNNLPTVDELLDLCGESAAKYLADGFNDAAFNTAKDPFDAWIPDDLDDEQYKRFRTAIINMVNLTGKEIPVVAKSLLAAMGR